MEQTNEQMFLKQLEEKSIFGAQCIKVNQFFIEMQKPETVQKYQKYKLINSQITTSEQTIAQSQQFEFTLDAESWMEKELDFFLDFFDFADFKPLFKQHNLQSFNKVKMAFNCSCQQYSSMWKQLEDIKVEKFASILMMVLALFKSFIAQRPAKCYALKLENVPEEYRKQFLETFYENVQEEDRKLCLATFYAMKLENVSEEDKKKYPEIFYAHVPEEDRKQCLATFYAMKQDFIKKQNGQGCNCEKPVYQTPEKKIEDLDQLKKLNELLQTKTLNDRMFQDKLFQTLAASVGADDSVLYDQMVPLKDVQPIRTLDPEFIIVGSFSDDSHLSQAVLALHPDKSQQLKTKEELDEWMYNTPYYGSKLNGPGDGIGLTHIQNSINTKGENYIMRVYLCKEQISGRSLKMKQKVFFERSPEIDGQLSEEQKKMIERLAMSKKIVVNRNNILLFGRDSDTNVIVKFDQPDPAKLVNTAENNTNSTISQTKQSQELTSHQLASQQMQRLQEERSINQSITQQQKIRPDGSKQQDKQKEPGHGERFEKRSKVTLKFVTMEYLQNFIRREKRTSENSRFCVAAEYKNYFKKDKKDKQESVTPLTPQNPKLYYLRKQVNEQVSKTHCLAYYDTKCKAFYLLDYGSRNGTFVYLQQSIFHTLKENDVFQLIFFKEKIEKQDSIDQQDQQQVQKKEKEDQQDQQQAQKKEKEKEFVLVYKLMSVAQLKLLDKQQSNEITLNFGEDDKKVISHKDLSKENVKLIPPKKDNDQKKTELKEEDQLQGKDDKDDEFFDEFRKEDLQIFLRMSPTKPNDIQISYQQHKAKLQMWRVVPNENSVFWTEYGSVWSKMHEKRGGVELCQKSEIDVVRISELEFYFQAKPVPLTIAEYQTQQRLLQQKY